jgi:hypothetical protein
MNVKHIKQGILLNAGGMTDLDQKHMLTAVDPKRGQLFVQINFVKTVCNGQPF